MVTGEQKSAMAPRLRLSHFARMPESREALPLRKTKLQRARQAKSSHSFKDARRVRVQYLRAILLGPDSLQHSPADGWIGFAVSSGFHVSPKATLEAGIGIGLYGQVVPAERLAQLAEVGESAVRL